MGLFISRGKEMHYMKVRARLSINYANTTSDKEREELAAWLRKQARDLLKDWNKYAAFYETEYHTDR